MSLKKIKLYVREDECCMDVLEYIDDHIIQIVKNGSTISFEKLDDANISSAIKSELARKRITRLPALVINDQVIIGAKGIQDYLGELKNKKPPPENAEMGEIGTNSDLSSFWEKELYSGMDRRGRLVPRKDKDEPEDEMRDYDKKLDEYRRNEPRHRRATTGRERNIEREQDREPRRTRRSRADPESDSASSEDNIGPARAPRQENKARASTKEDDMDERMLDAWMENNDI